MTMDSFFMKAARLPKVVDDPPKVVDMSLDEEDNERNATPVEVEERKCGTCHKLVPVNQFSGKQLSRGPSGECASCIKEKGYKHQNLQAAKSAKHKVVKCMKHKQMSCQICYPTASTKQKKQCKHQKNKKSCDQCAEEEKKQAAAEREKREKRIAMNLQQRQVAEKTSSSSEDN